MQDSRNMILAIVLSLLVLLGYDYFYGGPQREAALKAQQTEQAQQLATPAQPAANSGLPVATPDSATLPQAAAAEGTETFANRAEAIAAQPRIKIETDAVTGSINLVGARIDDLELKGYTETVDPASPIITLLSPQGINGAYFVEEGWAKVDPAAKIALPDATTLWTAASNAPLTPTNPLVLTWDNGAGLVFTHKIEIDDEFLFTVTQTVANSTGAPVQLYPYARVARHGTPHVKNFFVQHEGPLGVLGDKNLVSYKYTDLQSKKSEDFQSNGGWSGITDKYWATAVIAEPGTPINTRFSWSKTGELDIYHTSFVESTAAVAAANGTATQKSYVFAGAKEEAVIASYETEYSFDRLELLIDWGWLHFFTKPLFYLLRYLNSIIGNFGFAILAVTVIVKALFFPLANRSYASMAAMRRVQPEMKKIQEQFKEDRPGQQQAMMELYKREKINPLSGCWPILIQIPVFFSLYTVLFISLEMRHAPFFGWIQDLAAPDPTNIFNLFGLIPVDPTSLPVIGGFLALGVWPVIMGISMWVQMKLNPPPPDPTQAMIFSLMPIIFTFMLGTFPAGLVIYWAWNNTLSIIQQWTIMKRHGAEVDLFGNILTSLGLRKPPADKTAK